MIDGFDVSSEIGAYLWLFRMGSGNGVVTSSNKPLPELMLTPIYVAM